MNIMKKALTTTALLSSVLLSSVATAQDAFKVCWSHYTGWEPYGLLEQTGILQKWEDKYGIDIEITLINDYIESINLYTAGKFDACTMTNMDALTIPAVGGVDSTAIIYGDYSNGNDGIVLKNGKSLEDLKGRDVMLVELSVSHYLLSRALSTVGMSERDLQVINTSDADIAALFETTPNAATVTWNPPLQSVRYAKGAKMVFDSSQIPQEIMDLLVVKSDADERFKKAITGAWYELMAMLATKGTGSKNLISLMAANSGATDDEFRAQLKTTHMYYQPGPAAAVFESAQVVETMDYVRNFSFDKGLFGQGASDPDFVGIEFSGGRVLGDSNNIKLRFDSTYMQMAADGKL
ncbi:putative urea ABC transporter substrate-binding protein [Alteromonas macleodii]|uniref:NMT1/THI5 like family protein n=1 Tax=Alteromonas macleodii TaxID=28108 RepID=A0AB36FM87_ALTMA|nr:putative urea ABC transporter substrate-binding protein [Alteromonas macleodii]OES24171.1 NMT1/THI5 like family protein [Alteromonas macleodii]OES24805.1 NMT1/THI5 like family protein [Alteromonas macleodii]OES25083.1 NMT1/THI5 like family protein [Alteromonas macleodii]OES39126.1 NMT1/THI5 like family protein [Alteromonas macleodii]